MAEEIMDFLLDEEQTPTREGPSGYWNVMIVDDDVSVHQATKYALSGFRYLERPIQWFDAYSAAEARAILGERQDVALLFLDVVMEEDDAGLKFASWFREEGINPATRIILRTGQPGQAPERKIIMEYDLHDYKTKTELTSDKLFTSTVSALRAYHDMQRLEETRAGLESIVKSTANIFRIQTVYDYAKAVLQQIENIIEVRSSGIICAQNNGKGGWQVLAKSGAFVNDEEKIFSILDSKGEKEHGNGEWMVRILAQDENNSYAIYIEPSSELSDIQNKMLMMFCNNVSVGLRNIKLYGSLLNANRVTVMSLAQVTESRDKSTGEHVFRIANLTERFLQELLRRELYPDELSDDTVQFLGLSSTLHDIGKVVVKDNILLKPDRLTPEEFDEIKLHTINGANILDSVIKNAGESVRYLEMGKEIALYHHERWDGTGYPHRLKERDIPIAARITAIVDVYDALTHERCYKPAYSHEQAIEIIQDGRGTLFDPVLTDVFLDIAEEMSGIPEDVDVRMDFIPI